MTVHTPINHSDSAALHAHTGLGALLLWMQYWVLACCGARFYRRRPLRRYADTRENKCAGRMDTRPIPTAVKLKPFHIYPHLRLTPTQCQEHMCRLSIYGRVRIYRIRRTCSVLLRRPLLRCYDHGWWDAPSDHLFTPRWIAILRPN